MRRTVIALLFLLGLVAMSNAMPAPIPAPIQILANPATPANGTRTLQLEELWRRGSEDDDEIFFGLINQVAVDEDGNTYLLDGQLSQVPVFDPSGELINILSREGDGPGETRRPVDLQLTDDGRVGLAVGFPGRVVYVDLQGEPAGVLKVGGDPSQGGFTVVRSARANGDLTVLGASAASTDREAGTQTRTPRVAIYDADGNATHVLHEESYVIDFTERLFREAKQMELALRRVSVGHDGRIYFAPNREDYRIDVFEADGTPVRSITREYPVHKRSAEEMEEWRKLFLASVSRAQFPPDIELSLTAAPIDWIYGGLWARDDGTLWVRSSRAVQDLPAGIMLTYDVFDHDGRFTEQVQIACPGDGTEDALFFAGPDRMILVRGFMDSVRAMFGGVEGHEDQEAEPLEIVCYRVQ